MTLARLLEGLLVVELAGVLAGPSTGQCLAELGARVVKVEPPRGDVTRTWHLPSENADDDRPAYFACCNRGKESLVLDLTTDADRALLHRLARRADIVVAAYRPGAAVRLGADAAALRARNPRLIYASLSGYGPADARAGYDAVVQAEAGFTHLNGTAEAPGMKMPVALMDVLAAHQLKEGVLAALLQRERTGAGCTIDVSLLAAGASALVNQATNWLVGGQEPRRMGSAHPNIAPYGTSFATRTGARLVLAVGTDAQFAALCDVLGLAELPSDPRFADNAARVRHRGVLHERLVEAIAGWERDALLARLAARHVPAGAVRTVPEVFAHPEAARLVARGEGPAGLRQAIFADPAPLRAAPHLDADGAALREEFGSSAAREHAAAPNRTLP